MKFNYYQLITILWKGDFNNNHIWKQRFSISVVLTVTTVFYRQLHPKKTWKRSSVVSSWTCYNMKYLWTSYISIHERSTAISWLCLLSGIVTLINGVLEYDSEIFFLIFKLDATISTMQQHWAMMPSSFNRTA